MSAYTFSIPKTKNPPKVWSELYKTSRIRKFYEADYKFEIKYKNITVAFLTLSLVDNIIHIISLGAHTSINSYHGQHFAEMYHYHPNDRNSDRAKMLILYVCNLFSNEMGNKTIILEPQGDEKDGEIVYREKVIEFWQSCSFILKGDFMHSTLENVINCLD